MGFINETKTKNNYWSSFLKQVYNSQETIKKSVNINLFKVFLNNLKLTLNFIQYLIHFMSIKKLPIQCPSCSSELKVEGLYCDSCDTKISGLYNLPLLLKLEHSEQEFIIQFIRSSGSLKIMAQQLKLSYPTVRNILDELIQKIETLQQENHD